MTSHIKDEELELKGSSGPAQASHFRFMDLGPELRVMIMRLLLTSNQRLSLKDRAYSELPRLQKESWLRQPLAVQLCLVNTEVGREARRILYSENVFMFETAGQFIKFKEHIGRNFQHVGHLRLEDNFWNSGAAQAAIDSISPDALSTSLVGYDGLRYILLVGSKAVGRVTPSQVAEPELATDSMLYLYGKPEIKAEIATITRKLRPLGTPVMPMPQLIKQVVESLLAR